MIVADLETLLRRLIREELQQLLSDDEAANDDDVRQRALKRVETLRARKRGAQ
jgi:hypothetical protein